MGSELAATWIDSLGAMCLGAIEGRPMGRGRILYDSHIPYKIHTTVVSTRRMSDSAHRGVPGVMGREQIGDANKSVTKSDEPLPAQPSHSRNSSWNVHGGLFSEMDGFPSVSVNNQSNSVTSDDVISAQCFDGYASSPVRGAGRGDGRFASRRSVTPQKTGVRGVAVRLASCEKSVRRGHVEPSGVDPCSPQAGDAGGAGEAVQMDSAPRTNYEGILKRLEFMSGGCGCTAETLQNTRLIFTRLKETLEGRGTPVRERRGRSPGAQHLTPVIDAGVAGDNGDTATKKLTFTMTNGGEGAGNVPATVNTRYRGSARRVTFGRVSMDGGVSGMRPVVEDVGGDGFSFHTMTNSAGSTPYSGKTFGKRQQQTVEDFNGHGDGVRNMITKDQLASALKKSLTFAGTDQDEVGEGVEQQFSFGWDQIKETTRAHSSHDQAGTPDFSTFKAFKTTSRRFVTPPSQSRRLLELHGKARRVSSTDLSIDVDHSVVDNDENTAVTTTGLSISKLAKFSLPRHLDVTEAGTAAKDGAKHHQLSSPTEQVIRKSLKMERTKRLSSASKFNQSSS